MEAKVNYIVGGKHLGGKEKNVQRYLEVVTLAAMYKLQILLSCYHLLSPFLSPEGNKVPFTRFASFIYLFANNLYGTDRDEQYFLNYKKKTGHFLSETG